VGGFDVGGQVVQEPLMCLIQGTKSFILIELLILLVPLLSALETA
jgi:hypothetical protein